VTRLEEEKNTMSNYNSLISNRLRNYTCADENMETSLPVLSPTHATVGRALTLPL
jgi:uncharacterized protein YmfQ (DUF2313 family)